MTADDERLIAQFVLAAETMSGEERRRMQDLLQHDQTAVAMCLLICAYYNDFCRSEGTQSEKVSSFVDELLAGSSTPRGPRSGKTN